LGIEAHRPTEFAAFVSADATKWPRVVKAAGLKAD